MATGGGDIDRSDDMLMDTILDNDDSFAYNVSTQNRFLPGDGWGNADGDWQFVERSSKRKRINTGSVSRETFQNLSTDENFLLYLK